MKELPEWLSENGSPTSPPPPHSARRGKAGSPTDMRNSTNKFHPWNTDTCAYSHRPFTSWFGSNFRDFNKNYSHRPFKDKSAVIHSFIKKNPLKRTMKKKWKVDSTKMWFDLLCWFHEVKVFLEPVSLDCLLLKIIHTSISHTFWEGSFWTPLLLSCHISCFTFLDACQAVSHLQASTFAIPLAWNPFPPRSPHFSLMHHAVVSV